MGTSLNWAIKQRVAVIPYRHLGTTYRSQHTFRLPKIASTTTKSQQISRNKKDKYSVIRLRKIYKGEKSSIHTPITLLYKPKGAITKDFFPSVESRLAVNFNLSPDVTTIMTGHGNIRSYIDSKL